MSTTIETMKSLAARIAPRAVLRRLNFMPTRTSGGGNYGFTSNVATHDYELTQGDVLDNSVVAACVNAIAQALPEAPILLEKRIGGNEFERVDSHPVLDLLHNPNPYLSEAELWGITTAFERTRGEAFWYFEYEAGGSVPREIWFRAPQYVQTLSDAEHFVAGYNITAESGKMVALGEGDVVHFRHQLSATNPRAGWSPLQTGRRQIVGDNNAATYHAAILRNAGAASLIISLKDAAAAGEVTPGQLDEYVQQFKRKTGGSGAGAILGMDLPLDVHKVGFSPDEMALDRLLEHYESRICALLGVNRRVINLGQDPTYENSRVALKDFWQRTIIPMRRRHAATLSSQILPLFGLDPAIYRLSFDFSHVEALRDDVDALHARWRATFTAGGIDLYTFQEKIGLKPDESYRGRYAKGSSALSEEVGGGSEELKAVWNEADHPRASDGRFGHVAGLPRALTTQRVSGSGGGSGSASDGKARAKLHQEHGVGRDEHRILHESAAGVAESAPEFYTFIGSQRVEEIMSDISSWKRPNLTIDEVAGKLVAMHDEHAYKTRREHLEKQEAEVLALQQEIDHRADNFTLSEIDEKLLNAQIDLLIEQSQSELDAIRKDHEKRYPEMWKLLIANDKPVFTLADFDIDPAISPEDRESIEKGINFMARMLKPVDGKLKIPSTKDLKWRFSNRTRAGFVGEATDEWEANTIIWRSKTPEREQARADTAVHELAHWLEFHHPNLTQLLKEHYAIRTAGEQELDLQKVNPKLRAEEKYKEDDFIVPYMGKVCKDENGNLSGHNEILSVGLEYFVHAPDVLAKHDPATFYFIYTLLRGETPEVDPKKVKRKIKSVKELDAEAKLKGENQ